MDKKSDLDYDRELLSIYGGYKCSFNSIFFTPADYL